MFEKQRLKGLKFNEPSAKYTTFKIGGPAKYFFVAKNDKDLVRALAWAKEKKVPYFILGGGSNLLVSDKGFGGIVIKIQDTRYKIQKNKIIIGSGILLSKLVSLASKRGLSGLEWAVGIPGTVGGAVRGNAGAFGSCIGDVTQEVEVLEIRNPKSEIRNKSQISNPKSQNHNFKFKTLKKKECQFLYRNSIFKKNLNLIILSVNLQLKKGEKNEIQKKINKYLNYRKKVQPLNSSAGSVFKNIEIASLKNKNILKIIPQEKIKGGKLPAGYLIEKVGLRGKKQGQAQIAEKHANFIVNLGGAKAQDVISLINLAKRKVKKKFGIELEEEIKYLGF